MAHIKGTLRVRKAKGYIQRLQSRKLTGGNRTAGAEQGVTGLCLSCPQGTLLPSWYRLKRSSLLSAPLLQVGRS